jgi:hypothetical protein
MRWFIQFIVLLLPMLVDAQQCGDSVTELQNALRSTREPEFVLRSAAILGVRAVPVLRERPAASETGPFSGPLHADVRAATYVALAKLGDSAALRMLEMELREEPFNKETIAKLEYVDTDAAIGVLMDYFLGNRFNKSIGVNFGDTSYSPISEVRNALIRMLPNAPSFPTDSKDWDTWWMKVKQHQIVTSAEMDVDGPQAKCWVRLAEWKFKDAVPRLYQLLGIRSVPVLQKIASYGPKERACSLEEFCGVVETVLAKAGDKEQFQHIVDKLNSTDFDDAVVKLAYVGGKDAVEALIDALDLHLFLHGTPRSTTYFKNESLRFRRHVLSALPSLVKAAPLPASALPTDENAEKWRTWWAANKGQDLAR